jgi:hypothetical protein
VDAVFAVDAPLDAWSCSSRACSRDAICAPLIPTRPAGSVLADVPLPLVGLLAAVVVEGVAALVAAVGGLNHVFEIRALAEIIERSSGLGKHDPEVRKACATPKTAEISRNTDDPRG